MDSLGTILVEVGVKVVFWTTGGVELPGLARTGSGLRESRCPWLGNPRLSGCRQRWLAGLGPCPSTGTGPSILLVESLEGPGPGGVVPVMTEFPLVKVETGELIISKAGEAEVGVQCDTRGRDIWGSGWQGAEGPEGGQ